MAFKFYSGLELMKKSLYWSNMILLAKLQAAAGSFSNYCLNILLKMNELTCFSAFLWISMRLILAMLQGWKKHSISTFINPLAIEVLSQQRSTVFSSWVCHVQGTVLVSELFFFKVLSCQVKPVWKRGDLWGVSLQHGVVQNPGLCVSDCAEINGWRKFINTLFAWQRAPILKPSNMGI